MRRTLALGALIVTAIATLAAQAVGSVEAGVTLVARPTVGNPGPVELSGFVDSGQADEIVDIFVKDCGQGFFRGLTATRTRAGGGFSTTWFPGISTSFRARWNDLWSAPVSVRFRAGVGLRKLKRGGLFEVSAGGKTSFWRKRVLIQQRRGGAWKTVATIVLTEGWASGAGFAGSAATFKPTVPKGSLIRAFLPLSQARPCYLAGVSDTVRT